MRIRNMPSALLLSLAVAALIYSGCAPRAGRVQTTAGYNLPAGTEETVAQSNEIIKSFVTGAAREIPADVLANAAAIAVIPELTKAAFVVGGQRGTGVLVTRDGAEWSLPVFTSITGLSLGWQAGIQMTDLVLVFQNPEAVRRLKGGSFELGADASVAAGPIGGTAAVGTRADVLAYQRDRGAFIGASVSGARMAINPERTADYYYAGEPRPTTRAYYGLTDELLYPTGRLEIRNIPRGAMELKETLDRIAPPAR